MAAISSFFVALETNNNSQSNITTLNQTILINMQKTYPQRYMENAINYYLNVCV